MSNSKQSQLTSDDMKVLMARNKLIYDIDVPDSVVVEKNYRSYKPNLNSYSSGNIIDIQINSGSLEAYGPNCFLKCSIVVSGNSLKLCRAGAHSIVERAQLIGRNGVVIEDSEETGLLCSIKNKKLNPTTVYTSDTRQSIHLDMSDGFHFKEKTLAVGTHTVYLDMSKIFGFFARKDILIPHNFLAGMRVLLTIAPIAQMFSGISALPTSLTIDNPLLHVQTYRLASQFSNALDTESLANGLDFSFVSYESNSMTANSTNYDLDNNSSLSSVFNVLGHVRASNSYTTNVESFKSDLANFSSYQVFWGTETFPNVDLVSDINDVFIYMCDSFNKLNGSLSTSIDRTNVDGLLCASLERDSSGKKLNGVETNADRKIKMRVNMGTSADRTLTLFLEHLRVASCRGNNILIKY